MLPQYDISIIIVSYNCLEPLRECLDSLGNQVGPKFEIIVVDNDSRDGTRDYLKTQDCKSIFAAMNVGFGAAVNLAAREAQGQYILILNPDTIIPPGALEALYHSALQNPGFGLISPLLVHPNGAVQISARSLPRRCDLIFGRGSPLYWLGITKEKDAGYIEKQGNEPFRVPAISATAVLINADLFRELGGFDERFFMYMEDIDLCKRISDRSLDIWIVPDIKIIHSWRKSSSSRPYFSSFHHHLSIYKYFRKHFPGQSLANAILALCLCAGFMISVVISFLGMRAK